METIAKFYIEKVVFYCFKLDEYTIYEINFLLQAS